MSVLVTGGSGFVGSWVLRELIMEGHDVVVYDIGPNGRRWSTIIGDAMSSIVFQQGDLLDRECLEKTFDIHRISHVIHLGALLTPACHQDPFEGCRVNVLGSAALFEAVRARRDSIVGFSYASSKAALGDPDADVSPLPSVAAQDQLRTPTFYGSFKRSVELLAGQYWQHFQVPSVGLRPFIVYGPERVDGLTAGPSIACRAAVQGERYTIGYRGEAGYDLVTDVAHAFVRSALQTPPGAFVCDLDSQRATPEDLIGLIDRAIPGAGERLSADGPMLPNHSTHYDCCIDTLYSDWRTSSLSDGIDMTIDFYREMKQR